jgi:putative tricarboxylic transport membrane protein
MVNNNIFDLGLMILIGMIGYLLRRLDFSHVPLILGLVLGDKIEMSFRRSLIMSNGNPLIFITRPISVAILILAVIFVILLLLSIRKKIVKETRE